MAGVIGIGNILLISVKERTKEIGIRRALGARPSQVRTQILIESVFLTILAGIIGIILGTLILLLSTWLLRIYRTFHTNPTVPLEYILDIINDDNSWNLIGLIPAQSLLKLGLLKH